MSELRQPGIEVAPAREFFADPRHPYARLLLRALPDADRRGQSLAAIRGSVPPLTMEFTGCRFTPRCDRVMVHCAHIVPPLADIGRARAVRCLLYTDPREPIAPRSDESPPIAATRAAPSASVTLLDVQNLRVRFPIRKGLLQRTRGYVDAVGGVSFSIASGRTLALVGESGCGKTTTGKAIVQLLRTIAVIEGRALLDGDDLFALRGEALVAARRKVQIIFQDPFASLDPRMRVYDILEEGLLALRAELDAAARRRSLEALVDQVGLRRETLDRYPHEFSGGQRQRIAIARALAVQPKLIVCDEPTSALDVSVQAQILNLLRELQRELGVSYLFITHNIGVVEYIADDVAVMREGRLEESGAAGSVLERPQREYTRALLAAVPRVMVAAG